MTRKQLAPGSITSGTLRHEDVVPALLDALEDLNPQRANDLLAEYDDALLEGDDEVCDEVWYEALDALEAFAPEGHYVGAHEGDGADIGCWPLVDSLDDEELIVDRPLGVDRSLEQGTESQYGF